MTPEQRDELRSALIPNLPGASSGAIEWLITLLARVENVDLHVRELEERCLKAEAEIIKLREWANGMM